MLAGISTWPGEEKMLIDLVQSLRLQKINIKLLIIPRHAERRHEIRKSFQTSGLPHHLRTEDNNAPAESIAYLADTTGEVMTLLQSADFAFMGKSLPSPRWTKIRSNPLPLVCHWSWVQTIRIFAKHVLNF